MIGREYAKVFVAENGNYLSESCRARDLLKCQCAGRVNGALFEQFGSDVPLGRVGQPAKLAPVYVLLASDDGSYVSGARIAVTGGRPVL